LPNILSVGDGTHTAPVGYTHTHTTPPWPDHSGTVFRIMLIPFVRRCGRRKESLMERAFSPSRSARPLYLHRSPYVLYIIMCTDSHLNGKWSPYESSFWSAITFSIGPTRPLTTATVIPVIRAGVPAGVWMSETVIGHLSATCGAIVLDNIIHTYYIYNV